MVSTASAIERQRSINIVQAEQAIELAEVDRRGLHELDGYSSIASFARHQMGLSTKQARAYVRVGRALADLPDVRAAALAGHLTFEHLTSFDYAIRIVDRAATIEAEAHLLDLATAVTATQFHTVVRHMREASLDALDKAWRDGMDKQDLYLSKTLEGWQVAGFLSIDLGTKFKTLLDSFAVPREAGDLQTASERRLESLESLCDAVLDNGLPTSNGIKPQLHVVVDVDDDSAHAKLEKFGPIGPALVAHLACDADWLTIKTRNREVLDVGRRHRFATAKQTEAVLHQQDGECAGPGCTHPVGHIHHLEPWSVGGRTDLDNLIGLCGKCHTLVHQGRIDLQPKLARAG